MDDMRIHGQSALVYTLAMQDGIRCDSRVATRRLTGLSRLARPPIQGYLCLRRPNLVGEDVARRWRRLVLEDAQQRTRRRVAAPARPVAEPRAPEPCCILDRQLFRSIASPLRRPSERRWRRPMPASHRPGDLAGALAIRADRSERPGQPARRLASHPPPLGALRRDALPSKPPRFQAMPAAPAPPGRRQTVPESLACFQGMRGLRAAGPWRSSL